VDYPDRCEAVIEPLDLFKVASLSFSAPDTEAFPLLALAGRAISDGGACPAVVNAADEIAVAAFLSERLSFTGISEVVLETYERIRSAAALARTLEEITAADREARKIATNLI